MNEHKIENNITQMNNHKKFYSNALFIPLHTNDAINSLDIFDDLIIFGTLMGNLISGINEKGYNDEGKEIVPLLDTLCINKQCVPPFVQFNGIDACIALLNDNDINIECISSVFNMLKNVANASEEYKKILQDKKVP